MWIQILDLAKAFLTSESGMIITAGVVSVIAGKIFKRKPKLEQLYTDYAGTIKSAIAWSEKVIPDNHPAKNVQRLDTALKMVLEFYSLREKKVVSTDIKFMFSELINRTHAENKK